MTPLNEAHKKLGAKMVDFGGWEMPVQYEGIIDEHNAVRTKAGLFDVSHMGTVRVNGSDALNYLQKMVSNDLSLINPGQIQYVMLCNHEGGVIDDLLVYQMDEDDYILIVNAGNKEKDLDWLQKHQEGNLKITDNSASTAILALQGPLALEILQQLTDINLDQIKYYEWKYGKVNNRECIISRTGYTGEDGFEIYFKSEYAEELWDKIFEIGKDKVLPAGLGARDTLRFEAGLPLYGHELNDQITPLEANLGRFVVLEKEYFAGIEALRKQKADGLARKLVGFEMVDKGIARAEYKIFSEDEEIGFVTTGSPAPFLNKNLGNALVKVEFAEVGKEIFVEIRGKKKKAIIIKTPFYKRG